MRRTEAPESTGTTIRFTSTGRVVTALFVLMAGTALVIGATEGLHAGRDG